MQNGFCFGNCLIGMQNSAEIHNPKNKTGEINILRPTQTTYTWGKKPFTIVDLEKEEDKRSRYPDFQCTNLTFKWLLATLYDKTRFQSGKVVARLI